LFFVAIVELSDRGMLLLRRLSVELRVHLARGMRPVRQSTKLLGIVDTLNSVRMVEVARIRIVTALQLAAQTIVLIRKVLVCLAIKCTIGGLVRLETLEVRFSWQV